MGWNVFFSNKQDRKVDASYIAGFWRGLIPFSYGLILARVLHMDEIKLKAAIITLSMATVLILVGEIMMQRKLDELFRRIEQTALAYASLVGMATGILTFFIGKLFFDPRLSADLSMILFFISFGTTRVGYALWCLMAETGWKWRA